jgi:hypothetical protein
LEAVYPTVMRQKFSSKWKLSICLTAGWKKYMVACFASVVGFQELYQRYEKTRASLLIPAPLAQDNVHANMFRLGKTRAKRPIA